MKERQRRLAMRKKKEKRIILTISLLILISVACFGITKYNQNMIEEIQSYKINKNIDLTVGEATSKLDGKWHLNPFKKSATYKCNLNGLLVKIEFVIDNNKVKVNTVSIDNKFIDSFYAEKVLKTIFDNNISSIENINWNYLYELKNNK